LLAAIAACLLLSVGVPSGRLHGAESISLAGVWRFSLDRQDAGIGGQWYDKNLPDKIQLPGVLESQGCGDEIGIHTPWVLSLYDHFWYLRAHYAAYTNAGAVKVPFICQPPRHYLGAAWYQKDFEVPTNGHLRRLTLFMERPHWESRVWLDDQIIGTNNSLCAPHEFELGLVPPGLHRLTVRVDNRMILPYRPDAHSVSDSLDDAWNGIVGKIELGATEPLWIDDLQVYPHIATKSVTIRGHIGNLTGQAGTNRLGFFITPFRFGKRPEVMASANYVVAWDTNGGTFETELNLKPSAELWNEFHPTIYRLAVFLQGGDAAGVRGVLAQDKNFAQTSGRFQLVCYKEEIEANLRTPGMAGFQLLDLHDYTGQGTALVGLLDPFWKRKGYATPAKFKQFCNAVGPLARLTQQVFTTADMFTVDCEIANFSKSPLEGATPVWQILNNWGNVVASGELAGPYYSLG
jgi:beta-galactosidase